MGRVARLLFLRLDDHRFHLLVADRAGRTGMRLIAQPIQPTLGEASSPLAGRDRMATERCADLNIRLPGRRREHDPAA